MKFFRVRPNDSDVLIDAGGKNVVRDLTDSRDTVSCNIQENVFRLNLYILELFCMFRKEIYEAGAVESVIIDILTTDQRSHTAACQINVIPSTGCRATPNFQADIA